tara:strand:+ start:1016 stop:1147 length:132 start_codon:yes stop_codon:yes gene_type:complete
LTAAIGVLARYLSKHGFSIDTLGDGEEMRELLPKKDCEIVIRD